MKILYGNFKFSYRNWDIYEKGGMWTAIKNTNTVRNCFNINEIKIKIDEKELEK